MLHVIRKVNGTVALAIDSILFHAEHLSQVILPQEDCYPIRYRNLGKGLMDSQMEWKDSVMSSTGVVMIYPLSTAHDLMVQCFINGEWVAPIDGEPGSCVSCSRRGAGTPGPADRRAAIGLWTRKGDAADDEQDQQDTR